MLPETQKDDVAARQGCSRRGFITPLLRNLPISLARDSFGTRPATRKNGSSTFRTCLERVHLLLAASLELLTGLVVNGLLLTGFGFLRYVEPTFARSEKKTMSQ